MKHIAENKVFVRGAKPSIFGTGFIALDLVLSGNKSRWLWAGGTCGNVLTILSYLGWDSYPIARFSGDSASKLLMEDMRRWGVRLKFTMTTPSAKTPIVIEQIGEKVVDGEPRHRFTWLCPACGSWVPGYAPILLPAAREIAGQIGAPKVFFLDRVSPAALLLARQNAERGTLIVFEPSGVSDPRLFVEALNVAHIVKYSRDRMKSAEIIEKNPRPFLQIETLGKTGLRYQARLTGCRTKGWKQLDSFSVADLKDTAGAGDWCTAGIIHTVGTNAFKGFKSLTHESLQYALRFGQALAAWNCMFEGARGGMYAVGKRAFSRDIKLIQQGHEISTRKFVRPPSVPKRLVKTICRSCIQP